MVGIVRLNRRKNGKRSNWLLYETGTRTTGLEFLDVVLVCKLRRAVAPGKLGPPRLKSRVVVLVSAPRRAAAPRKLGPPRLKSRVVVLVSVPRRAAAPRKLGPPRLKSRVVFLVSAPGRAAVLRKLGPQAPKSRVLVLVFSPWATTASPTKKIKNNGDKEGAVPRMASAPSRYSSTIYSATLFSCGSLFTIFFFTAIPAPNTFRTSGPATKNCQISAMG